MRVKLCLENESGLRKRKLWYLIDDSSCVKVNDVTYLIKKRFYNKDCKISLTLDGFMLPPQEKINIIRDNDEILVKIISHKSSSSGASSESEPDEKNKVKKDIPNSNRNLILKKKNRTFIKPIDVLKKVSRVITGKSSFMNGTTLKKSAAKQLVQTNGKSQTLSKNVISTNISKPLQNTNKTDETSESESSSSDEADKKSSSIKIKVPPSKKNSLMVKIPLCLSDKKKSNIAKNKKVTSSESSDSSSSSSSHQENVPVKKAVTINKKIPPVNGSIKKTIPLSKLGVCNSTKKVTSDSSDSSDSSDEAPLQKKKKISPQKLVSITEKKKVLKKDSSSESSDDSSSSSDAPELVTKKNVSTSKRTNGSVVLPAVKKFLGIAQSDNKKSSPLDETRTLQYKTKDNVSIIEKDRNNVHFEITKINGGVKNTSTPNNSNKRSKNETCKAKMLAAKDVYKNKSQFINSNSTSIENTVSSISLNNSTNRISELEETNDSITSTNNVSAGTLRRRRRAKLRKERKRNQIKAENEVNISDNEEGTIVENGNGQQPTEQYKTNGFMDQDTVLMKAVNISGSGNGQQSTEQFKSNGFMDQDTVLMEAHCPKDYSCYERLTSPPDIGSKIAFKILEMNSVTYTPEVSNCKEALIKNSNTEDNMIELELCEEPMTRTQDDSQMFGKFEMPDCDEENIEPELEKQIFVTWNQLIEPRLVV